MSNEFAVIGTSNFSGPNPANVAEGATKQLRTIVGARPWMVFLATGVGLLALDEVVKNPDEFEGGEVILPSLFDRENGKFDDSRDESRSRLANHEISTFSRSVKGDLDYYHKVVGESFGVEKLYKKVMSAPRNRMRELASREQLVAMVFIPKMKETVKKIIYGESEWADPGVAGITHRDTADVWRESTARIKYIINLSKV